jgi:hypothetical protein
MTERQIKYTLGILGCLDLVSFLRVYDTLYTLEVISAMSDWDVEFWDKVRMVGMPILNWLLVFLILASGVLLLFGKRAGIVVYYFEFPLRLLFITLTFGFILRVSGLQVDSLSYKIVLALLAGLEFLRLAFSIWVQRRFRGTIQNASP